MYTRQGKGNLQLQLQLQLHIHSISHLIRSEITITNGEHVPVPVTVTANCIDAVAAFAAVLLLCGLVANGRGTWEYAMREITSHGSMSIGYY